MVACTLHHMPHQALGFFMRLAHEGCGGTLGERRAVNLDIDARSSQARGGRAVCQACFALLCFALLCFALLCFALHSPPWLCRGLPSSQSPIRGWYLSVPSLADSLVDSLKVDGKRLLLRPTRIPSNNASTSTPEPCQPVKPVRPTEPAEPQAAYHCSSWVQIPRIPRLLQIHRHRHRHRRQPVVRVLRLCRRRRS